MEKIFELSAYNGVVVAPRHPGYFSNRFVLKVDNHCGVAVIENNGYTLNRTAIDEIKKFVIKNLKKLKSLSKKKESPWEGGSSSSISLKYDDIELTVSCYIGEDDYYKIFDKLQEIIKNAVENGNVFTDENSPNPVKDAEEWTKSAKDLRFEQEYNLHYSVVMNKRKRIENMLQNLRKEFRNGRLNRDSQIVEEITKEISHYFSSDNCKDYLVQKDIKNLSYAEAVGQFKFWLETKTLNDVLENGVFLNFFEQFKVLNEKRGEEYLKDKEAEIKHKYTQS